MVNMNAQNKMASMLMTKTASSIMNVDKANPTISHATKLMVFNFYITHPMFNVIGQSELNVIQDQFVIKMMKIVIQTILPLQNQQFVRAFLVIMETVSTLKVIVTNVSVDVLEELIMKLVVMKVLFSIQPQISVIGLGMSMDAELISQNKIFY